MQTHEHCKTQIFTLIGRRIVLYKPHADCTEGMIAEQISPARYGCYLRKPDGRIYMSGIAGRPVTVDLHRAEFHLPPLPKNKRQAYWLPEDSEGFAYADQPNF